MKCVHKHIQLKQSHALSLSVLMIFAKIGGIMMSRFLLRFDVKEARGYQTYAVDNARDPEHALELHNKGESEFIDEEFEIMDLDEDPDIILD